MSSIAASIWTRFRRDNYVAIAPEADGAWRVPEKGTMLESSSRNTPSWLNRSLILLFCVLSMIGGYVFGLQSQKGSNDLPSWAKDIPRAQIGFIEQKWEYDPQFGAAPPVDNSTEAEWDELIPKGQGFVRFPEDAPHVSAVSAIHQLHCLYSIRRSLFAEPGVPIAGINMEHLKPPHMRHCFDYLRQALLCSADSTLEPYRTDLGGVTGWGFPRVCRNFQELKHWAEARRTNNREGFIEVLPPGVSHEHPE